MRKLFLMLGSPASGKSTYLRNNNLMPYTVSSDTIRTLLGNDHAFALPNNSLQTQATLHGDSYVWQEMYNIVEQRMKNGQTTFVDATHLFRGAFNEWNKLRLKYNYTVYVIDMMKPLFDKYKTRTKVAQELLKRNQSRERQVPDFSINNNIDHYLKFKPQSYMHMIDGSDPSALQAALAADTLPNMEKFKRIQVIGDIHADYDALQEVFKSHTKGTAYIFVGDYLDRGSKTLETFTFITQDLKGNNLFFCIGNHENSWESWVQNRQKRGQFSKLSLVPLLKEYGADQLDEIIKTFLKDKHTRDYFVFDYYGKTYYVSHAGFEPAMAKQNYPVNLLARTSLIYGVSALNQDDPYNRDIDTIWRNTMPDSQISLHGHRNNFNRFVEGNSYNLTGDDDKFRWLTITPDGIEPHEIERIDKPDLDAQLVMEPHIRQKENPDGIISNNFDKEAFFNNIWSSMSLKARGLFTRNNQVVGRGYQKFFNLDQLPGETLESLGYPVIIERKHNGFLAIALYDNQVQKLKIFSKSGDTKYAGIARDVLKQTGYLDKLEEYFANSALCHTSITFEIVDPVRDPHVIKYSQVHAFPLSIIQNDMNGRVLNLSKYFDQENKLFKYPEFKALADDMNDLNILAVVHDLAELKQKLAELAETYATREGFVLYAPNKMLKIKSPFYLKAKELRSAMQHGYKNYWHYGAQDWFKYTKKNHIRHFTPDLALELFEKVK